MNNLLKLIPVGLALFCLGVLYCQPRWIFVLANSLAPGVTYFVPVETPTVALTIDDGPDAQTTPEILNILKRHNAQATFFLISRRVFGNESLVHNISDNGHEIGNHLTEDTPSITLAPDEFESALLEAGSTLTPLSNVPLEWVRPASGWYTSEMVRISHRHHYKMALGSVFPYDTHIPSSTFAVTQILSTVRKGSIIVLHDGGNRGIRTAQTLAKVLPALQQKGYKIVTLTELLQQKGKSVR